MNRLVAVSLLMTTFGIVLFSCKKSDNTCNYDACSVKAGAIEVTNLESYLSGAGITGATKTCSGLYYQVLSPGADRSPSVCSYVTVNYKGMLTNGTVFDSTATNSPASFPLITLIEGWKQALPLIKKGGKIRMYLPPSLGYGSSSSGAIPANSILIFEVELLDIQ